LTTIKIGLEAGKAGLETVVEPVPVQLIPFFQLIAIGVVHSVEPIHELVSEIVAESLVELA
jgi:hypothetical protein